MTNADISRLHHVYTSGVKWVFTRYGGHCYGMVGIVMVWWALIRSFIMHESCGAHSGVDTHLRLLIVLVVN